eukprot:SAG22_NODE_2496_length_2510_cov_2.147657_2_plen_105_part_00
MLVFDDSYEHEAANPTNESRYVLYVSLWHPGLQGLAGVPVPTLPTEMRWADEQSEEPPPLPPGSDGGLASAGSKAAKPPGGVAKGRGKKGRKRKKKTLDAADEL